ncbi:PREDICTED: uncharacterized protein LOC104740862 [Camelina sativa]|uniref:Uncharacterized protein LOC104740862 n=1 Tax=Camelina sativa TaxID=90675 RepID=A0ABM1QVZ2_CAMSA|nr:PREDICTED: uncharacterized protein LOC104740862 [Camelina sativa]
MYLKVNNFPKDKKVYVIGGEGVLEELQIAGFTGLGGPILALSVKTSQTLDTSSSSAVFLSGGFSYYYLASGNNLVYLDQAKEETGPKTALNPDKWLEFKL